MRDHTPGPWEISRSASPDYAPEFSVYAGPGPKVAVVVNGNSEANARLIASAPDMLNALQRLTHPFATDEDVDYALSVIEKVTGVRPPRPITEDEE